MRVCFLGTYERDYPRNQILLKAMRGSGIDFFECHFDVWKNRPHKTGTVKNPFQLLCTTALLIVGYITLAVKYLLSPAHDVVLIGYPGHIDAIVLGWIPKLFRRCIVFDCFISLYDTVISDRKLESQDSCLASFLYWVDRSSCQQSDIVILDTNAHIDFFVRKFNLPLIRFRRVFAGADTELFLPNNEHRLAAPRNFFNVLFIGKYTPLHGIPIILEAAQLLLAHPEIRIKIIGAGQLFNEIQAQRERLKLTNVELCGWSPFENLCFEINQADLCLGIFSDSDKASRVIPNKIFQAAACGKAVLTSKNLACDELFQEGETIFYVSPNNSAELADKILELSKQGIALVSTGENARKVVLSRAGLVAIGSELLNIFQEMK